MDTINSNKLPGKIAFICQRANMSSCVLELSVRENIAFSHFINLDSDANSDSAEHLDLADIIDRLGSMHTVESILIYLESIQNIRKFMSAARSVSRVKPIIVLKSGRTGSLSESDSLYDAAFKRAGILRVNDLEEMFDCAKFIAIQKRPKAPKLTIVTNSESAGLMAVDALGLYGMEPSPFNGGIPVNIPVDAGLERYLDTVKNCVESPETDALLLIYTPPGSVVSSTIDHPSNISLSNFNAVDTKLLSQSLGGYLKTARCPVFTTWLERDDKAVSSLPADRIKDEFNKSGIITYDSPERGVRAFVNLCRYAKNIEMLQQIPVRKDRRLQIDKSRAKAVAESVLQRIDSAKDKILMTESEAVSLVGSYGILVDKTDAAESKSDYELMIDIKLDSAFGPVIYFGIGGVMTDIVEDRAAALPPLDNVLASQLMQEPRISRVFKGYGSIKPLNSELIEDMLIRLSRLVTDFPQIERLKINPIVVNHGEVTVTGVEVFVQKSDISPPMHLVISSYPFEYESEDETIEHQKIFIRPIKPSDAPLMIEHFLTLSSKSVYYRFFTPLKQLSQNMLIRFTQIDYDREIALIALIEEGENQIMVGVARIIFEHGGKKGEFSVLLGDKWHGKGIGAALLKRCLKFAAEKGVETVWGIVLSENRQMLKLAKKLGFNAKYISGSSECEIEIDLKKVTWE